MFDQAKDLLKLRKEAKKIQKELEKTHIEAEIDGVKIIINGKQEVISIDISDDALSNKKKTEESLVKAFNKAVKKSQEVGASLMKDVMGGFPGLT
ncbi:nucleoid-associated protein, YbaB/EbfC family [Candidatus Peregrinibacteria bacterium HGW-Peregrinibacteria-1]|jgi:DNA-binding YbaB/EbfC family protein|nr:MAG: nucleoid-associated protein, YbaB/EbfC family [Candidatus Peregrinibacteria bacterium HGW-Peregrinibacteria-1]